MHLHFNDYNYNCNVKQSCSVHQEQLDHVNAIVVVFYFLRTFKTF